MNRYTFLLQIHPDGPSTLENLSTHERIQIGDLASVGPQVERWLAELASPASPGAPGRDGEGPSPPAPPA